MVALLRFIILITIRNHVKNFVKFFTKKISRSNPIPTTSHEKLPCREFSKLLKHKSPNSIIISIRKNFEFRPVASFREFSIRLTRYLTSTIYCFIFEIWNLKPSSKRVHWMCSLLLFSKFCIVYNLLGEHAHLIFRVWRQNMYWDIQMV